MSDTQSEPSSLNRRETPDAALEALSHVHRFRLLKALRERNPREAIIAPVSDDAGPDAESESVRIEMYHIHLPKLDDAGFVEWDRERDQVRKGPKFETVEELLEQLDGTEQTLHV